MFIFIIFFEITLNFLIRYLKKDFKWFINFEDERPTFNKEKLSKFYQNSFDNLLGWDRKKNSKGFEKSTRKTFFNISRSGSRGKSKFKNTKFDVFGDSFAFCRYVNDNETWESFIEKKIKSKINNFGVGNYGLDQSYLKYTKYKNKLKSNTIIFNFVPETIARINSFWKHYREFGNTLAFKPIYLVNKDKLHLKRILIRKNFSQNKIHNTINKMKSLDVFYEKKFLKEKFCLPYSICYIKNIKKFSIVIFYLILFKFFKKKLFQDRAISEVLTQNIVQSHKMYKDTNFNHKLKSLIMMMNKQIKKDNKRMILIVSPQFLDLKSKYLTYSQNFFSSLPKEILCLDLSKYIQKQNYKKFYLEDKYGGHFNKVGNKYISKIIFNFLKSKKYI